MNPSELFNQVKELIEKKDFSAAQKFIDQHKDDLGDYLDKAKDLLAGVKGADGVLDKVKGLFGK
ncbi:MULTISPECIES: hypothetical protein [Streptococcus]|uniref:Isoleucyl-tRNA synthetase, putative n=1 Tax=Streptococcus downei MFe28 TaxID=764290 RepID=A0A380JGY7_STRDO|nr:MULTISPECIES: hypothetical protein [Streptococcus]AWN61840.1 hypothetical protein DLJ52_06365 [Streptococcus sobrinus]AWN63711.1 hypothetical protein DLJ51_06365 [Streptococcus sobrinus]EFQ57891.1 hypothetical protein HMPREF9176_1826 [Streptococcus downei F0415]SQG20385.1 Isoleucyl-tRNA synthetase, putative [Streptococcus sobrinus]SUN36662.1 Isoleucyl-tRNA synthetase, putative [Streptococcus downei MFe28]